MKTRARALAAGLMAVLVALSMGVLPAEARSHSGASSHAIATPGRSSVQDVEMTFASLNGPVAHVRTRADARSIRCRGCDATAVTVHIVLVDTPIRSVRAFNYANSMNQLCSNCTTTAGSYQIVVAGPGHIAVSPTGWSLLRNLERRLESTSATGPAALQQAESAVNEAYGILNQHATLQPTSGPGRRVGQRPDIQVLRDRNLR